MQTEELFKFKCPKCGGVGYDDKEGTAHKQLCDGEIIFKFEEEFIT